MYQRHSRYGPPPDDDDDNGSMTSFICTGCMHRFEYPLTEDPLTGGMACPGCGEEDSVMIEGVYAMHTHTGYM